MKVHLRGDMLEFWEEQTLVRSIRAGHAGFTAYASADCIVVGQGAYWAGFLAGMQWYSEAIDWQQEAPSGNEQQELSGSDVLKFPVTKDD